ncbi:MAG: SDR family oxidoreductase [Bacteroidetes bacterium]|nr:MAG: SDR family oxidoreductase [Bacteroidota bacterium]
MNIILFGATGSVGKQIIKQTLDEGHRVTAFTRSPEKLIAFSSANLSVVKGDILNKTDVESAVLNHDVVLCTIGDGNKGTVRGTGTRNIIESMQKHHIKRLICQTTLGLGESRGNLNFVWKHIMFGLLLKKAFKDHQLQEQYVFDSNLDYTIVRPSAFTDGQITRNYKIGFDGNFKKLSLKISRADVADFMLQRITSKEYLKQAVSISN